MTVIRPKSTPGGITPLPASTNFNPPSITTIEETGLSALWLQDLALKIIVLPGLHERFQSR